MGKLVATAAIIFAVSSIILLSLAHQNDYLLISGSESCILPAKNFSVSFIHSVELSEEVDFYYVQNGEIYLYKTLVRSAGWGLPSTENFTTTDEGFEYAIKRHIGVLRISTNPLNHYTVEVDERSISLDKFGSYLEIKVVRISPLVAALQRWC